MIVSIIAPFLLNKDIIHKFRLQMVHELSLGALYSLQSAISTSLLSAKSQYISTPTLKHVGQAILKKAVMNMKLHMLRMRIKILMMETFLIKILMVVIVCWIKVSGGTIR